MANCICGLEVPEDMLDRLRALKEEELIEGGADSIRQFIICLKCNVVLELLPNGNVERAVLSGLDKMIVDSINHARNAHNN